MWWKLSVMMRIINNIYKCHVSFFWWYWRKWKWKAQDCTLKRLINRYFWSNFTRRKQGGHNCIQPESESKFTEFSWNQMKIQLFNFLSIFIVKIQCFLMISYSYNVICIDDSNTGIKNRRSSRNHPVFLLFVFVNVIQLHLSVRGCCCYCWYKLSSTLVSYHVPKNIHKRIKRWKEKLKKTPCVFIFLA